MNSELPLGRHQRTDLFAKHDTPDVPRLVHVENDHRQVVVLAEAHGGKIHHLEPLPQDFHVGNLVVLHRVLHQHRVRTIDTFDFGTLQQNVGLDLHRPQACRRVGRKKWVPDASREDHNTAFLQMPHRPAANIWLRHLVHKYRGHHSALHPALLKRILQCYRIHHGRQHAHVVGGHPVHFLRLLRHPAKEIASSHNDPDLHAQLVDITNLLRDLSDLYGIQSKPVRTRQRLSRKLQNNPLVHAFSSIAHATDPTNPCPKLLGGRPPKVSILKQKEPFAGLHVRVPERPAPPSQAPSPSSTDRTNHVTPASPDPSP